MKKTKIISLMLACILCAVLFTSCEKPQKIDPYIKVTDMKGRELTFEKTCGKIVVTSAADCEILYALGMGDAVIGRGTFCNYPESVLNVTDIGSGSQTNIEQIIALNPDVVIMNTMDQTLDQVNALEKANIKVLATEATNIEGVYDCIGLLGKITGKTEKANEIIADMKSDFLSLSSKANEFERKSVYFEVSPLEYGLWTAGKNTFMNEIANILNLTNIFESVDGWASVSQENVIEKDPDYIVTITMYFGEGVKPVDEIKSRVGWENIKAIKNDKVFNANSDEISRPGPRLADAANALYEFIYEN